MSRRRRRSRLTYRIVYRRGRSGRRNPNYDPPNSTIHSRRKHLSSRIQGLRPRIAALQTQVRDVAEGARAVGCSYSFSTLAKIQHTLTELSRDVERASREVWS